MLPYAQVHTPSPSAKANAVPVTTPPFADTGDPDKFPIKLHVLGVRTMIATTILIVALACITYFLIDGLKLTTIEGTNLSDTEKKNLLDRYNSYSGGVASIVAIPFQKLVTLLIPVFFLCFSAKTFMKPDQSVVSQLVPTVGVLAITWLLGQSLNALNVQWETPSVEYLIANSDLVATDAPTTYDFVVSNATDTTHLAGVASTDTFLRSAIKPSATSFGSNCTIDEGTLYYSRNPGIRFGFPLNSWLEYMMPKSIASDKSFAFDMSTDFEAQDIDPSVLPSGDVESTAVLISYGLWSVCTQFLDGGVVTIEDVYDVINSSSASEMLTSVQNELVNVSSKAEIGLGSWRNFSIPETSIELATFQLSSQIKFEAVTFTFPLDPEKVIYFGNGVKNISDPGYADTVEMGTGQNCNDHVCILPTSNLENTNQDQIRILPLCMTEANGTDEYLGGLEQSFACEFQSNTSILVYSVSRHLAVDTVNFTSGTIHLKNPRVSFRITVGRLSWQSSDLTPAYAASCIADDNCNGLYFPLSNGNQHAVVGDANIPTAWKAMYPVHYEEWQLLVIADTQVSAGATINLVYPPNFPLAEGSEEWVGLSSFLCTFQKADLVNDIIQRHIYSKDPVQPAYTAALFWLFQNAAIRDIEVSNSTLPLTGVQLDFEGNRLWLSSRVSVPRTSAVLTFCGCALVLLIGSLILYGAAGSRVETKLTSQMTAHNVAGVRLGLDQYPSLIVRATVLASNDKDGELPGQDINAFDIDEVILRHKSDGSLKSVKITTNLPFDAGSSLP